MFCFVLQLMLGVGALVLLPNAVISREKQHQNNIGSLPNGKQWNHSVRVSPGGRDSPECLNNNSIACLRLYYVFENVRHQNSTEVYVEYGDYVLNESFTFWNVHDFAIIGEASQSGPDMGEVVINCKENSGLSFIYSSGIIMKNVILSACGTIQNSTSLKHPKFKTGLFLVNCIDLSIDKVLVREGPGIGMQLYDVSGTINISNSQFLNNGKPKMEDLETKFSGGGLYFEFTYMGGLYPFQKMPEPMYQNNGSFHFMNVFFEGNHAPKIADTVHPGGNQHDAFGRGGGASFFIKGSAQNNTFTFENCYFDKNRAIWGAGLFVEFQDSTLTNSLLFKSCFFRYNNAVYAGGGIRAGLITNNPNTSFAPNYIEFTLCYFEHNKATLGGGISLYGTTKHSYSFFHDQSFVNFSRCVIEWNTATVGSAFCSAVWDVDQYGEGGSSDTFKIYIANSIINRNTIISSSEGGNVSGIGAIYAQGTPVFLQNTNLTFNNITALVLDSAYVRIKNGHVYFINNTGRKGGAISLYGTSKIIVSDNASLIFIGNNCSVQGGAIYVKTPGPQMVAFNTTELILHSCFFDFDNESSGSVSFYNNKGPVNTSGHSVYASTLQFCRHPDENIMNNAALERKSFHYYYANGTKKYDMKYEIVTDAVKIEVIESEWDTTADKHFSPHVTLYDEKYNSVLGIVKIRVYPKKEVKLDPPLTYFLVQDEVKSSLKIMAKPSTNYLVSLETIDSQLAYSPVINATITGCKPGFFWDKTKCKCDNSPVGVSRCDDANQTLYLLKDYWAAQVDGMFVVVACPENYCNCKKNNSTASGECLYDKNNQCWGNREGRVCGECKIGTYLEVGEDECTSKCNSEGKKWIGYLVGLLIFSFFLVLIIMVINFDPFTAYLNAWLYFYQVLSILVPRYKFDDPFLKFIIGLAHFQLIGFGGVCMWPNMDDLQKFGFNYLLPFFVFISLFVLNKVVVKWPDNFITRRFTQTSSARAFCTLMVLSYSTVVDISIKILYPVKVGNNYYVFYEGNLKYFSTLHAIFFAFALFLLIFVGLLFPLVLIRRQCFGKCDNGLKKLLLDNFQRCFRDGYKWFAGFYFICRFFLSLVHISTPQGALQVSLLNSGCCIILAVFVFCQPYTENGGLVVPYRILNLSDTVLLCNLCLISSFGGAASGIYAHSYYDSFKIVIHTLSYIPLVFPFGLLAYYLRHRCTATQRLLENVDN